MLSRFIQSTHCFKPTRCISSIQQSYQTMLKAPLKTVDPEMYKIVKSEETRLHESLNLIASENFTSQAVYQCLSSPFHNKYAEGYPGARYYGGTEFADQMERLTQKRALQAYGLDPAKWGVNVQALSGSPANLSVYWGVLDKGSRLVGLGLPSGGHLSHGFETPTKKVSATADYFEWMHYNQDAEGKIDYEDALDVVTKFRPKMVTAGYSSYTRHFDYKRLREISDTVGAYLLADMAHISGLVATGNAPSPFDYCDLVTTTTHKTLQGARGALIFYRKGERSVDKKGKVTMYNFETNINDSVFPGHQGGPHCNNMAGIGTALHIAQTPEFKDYVDRCIENSRLVSEEFGKRGYPVLTGGTDNHMSVISIRHLGVDGARAEHVLSMLNISTSKQSVVGDKSAVTPSGIRIGSPCMTARGLDKNDWLKSIDFVDRGVKLAAQLKIDSKTKKMADYKAYVDSIRYTDQRIVDLKQEVVEFCSRFDFVPWGN